MTFPTDSSIDDKEEKYDSKGTSPMGQSAAAEPVNINISLYNSTLISPKDMLSKGNNTP